MPRPRKTPPPDDAKPPPPERKRRTPSAADEGAPRARRSSTKPEAPPSADAVEPAPVAPAAPAPPPAPLAAPEAAPAPAAARTIPPLPDEEDEFIPFEDFDAGSRDEPAAEQGAPVDPREVLERVRRGEAHVSALERLSDTEVHDLAVGAGVKPRPGERRTETIFRMLQSRPAAQAPRETVFVEGLLELHPDGYGFLRRPVNNYAQHPEDVYVSAGIVRRLDLKPGLWIAGQAQRARPGEPFFALQRADEINHEEPERLRTTVPFTEQTVVHPDSRFVLEVNPDDVEMRVMDLFCPLGRGQRAILVAPPRAGKTIILQKLADAIAHNHPDVDIVVLLVDERPEEVTNMRRSVRGEVIASTFDKPATNHVRVAELTMEKVKRLVEYGRHVVLLMDSITRLGRAYNNLAPMTGRILTGGMDAAALTRPKLFFAAARNIEQGGSLTIVGTSLVDTGSRLDQVVFEEFKGSGNMELVLSRDLANQRIWPAIDIPASGTRNEDLLLHPEELRRITLLRRAISDSSPEVAMQTIRDLMKQYRTNAELLMSMG
jgi:transcription termination factor Rho